MGDWREVTHDEFFDAIGEQNVHPRIVEPWPYTSIFEDRARRVFGKIERYIPEGEGLERSRYYLPSGGVPTT